MSFLVRHFYHSAPAGYPSSVRRIRKGAATAFVDRATGELIAGYSYNTCMLAVFADDSVAGGKRLYVNLTTFGPTTGKHVRWLYSMVPSALGCIYNWGSETFEVVRGIVPPADGYAGEGVGPRALRYTCENPTSVADRVARKRAEVDRCNAAIDREVAARCSTFDIDGIGTVVRVNCVGIDVSDALALADERRAQLE